MNAQLPRPILEDAIVLDVRMTEQNRLAEGVWEHGAQRAAGLSEVANVIAATFDLGDHPKSGPARAGVGGQRQYVVEPVADDGLRAPPEVGDDGSQPRLRQGEGRTGRSRYRLVLK